MAGCGRRRGLSPADAGFIAATLDNVTSARIAPGSARSPFNNLT